MVSANLPRLGGSRFAVVTVLKAYMSRAGHVGTNAKTGDPARDTVADAAAWLGEPAARTASGSRFCLLV